MKPIEIITSFELNKDMSDKMRDNTFLGDQIRINDMVYIVSKIEYLKTKCIKLHVELKHKFDYNKLT